MKKSFLLIMTVILLGSFIDLQAQAVNNWNWSFPQPVGQTLRWCKMWDANNWYAVGLGGTFIKTTNAGTSWKVSGPGYIPWRGDNTSFYDAHFFNMNTGIVAGYYGMWKTTNGGTNWDTVAINTTSSLYGIQFLNNNTGFVCGSSGFVQKTTDGGGTWTSITGNLGTTTCYSMYAFDANKILIGESSGDIWITTNGGTNWTEMLLPGGTVYRINFFDANTGYAVGSSTMVQLSTNGGMNWTTLMTPIPSSTLYDIDFTSVSNPPSTLLSQDFESATFPPSQWTLSGTSGIWSRITGASGYGTGTASARAYFYGVSSGQQNLSTDTIPATSAGDSLKFDHAYATYINEVDSLVIYTSTNAGTSWTRLIGLAGGVSGPLVTAPPTTSSFIPTSAQWATKKYALPVGTNMVRFTGVTAFGNNCYVDNIMVTSPASNGHAVYITGNTFAIYKSSNTGTTWDTLGFISPQQAVTSTYYATSLGANGDSLLTVGAFGLINKRNSASSTVTYRPDWTWFTATLNAVEVLGNKVMIPTSYSAILSTTNNGTDWDTARVDYTNSTTLYSISKVSNTVAWVAGSSGRAYYTTDAGATWSLSTTGTTSTLYNVFFVNANTGWVIGSSGAVVKTTNGGTNWATQTSGTTSTMYGSYFVDANTGWFIGSSGTVKKTTDGGTTWNTQTSNTTQTLRNIYMINPNMGYLVGYSGTIRKTTNGGTSWDTLQTPFYPYVSNYGVDFVDANNGMVTGASGLTLRTRDGGTTWEFENTCGATQYGVKMTSLDTGWACSSSGYVFKYASPPATGNNSYTHEVPSNYELSQNYPNPFNPTTTIRFGLPRAGMVSLKIYDVAGRLVRTLVNNEGLNEGTFRYVFNGADLSSGAYFYSLIVDNNLVDTKRMVLIK